MSSAVVNYKLTLGEDCVPVCHEDIELADCLFVIGATQKLNEDFPLILTTGRIRDQWHTMTKTGKVNKLNQHIGLGNFGECVEGRIGGSCVIRCFRIGRKTLIFQPMRKHQITKK